MYIEKRKLTKQEIQHLSTVITLILILVFVVLLFVFWNTQILKKRYYNELARGNIIKDLEVNAPRGLVLDRTGKRLAENKLNFTLFMVREFSKNIGQTVETVHRITGMEKEAVQKKIEKYKHYPEFFMIPLAKDLPLEQVIYIESRSDELPELKIEIEPARAYPYGEMASHVLGYLSELSSGELEKKRGKGYAIGDLGGKSGIERIYESSLKGKKGVRTVARDNLGQVREVMSEQKPVIGRTVILTIDLELQKYVEEIFKPYKGAIGVVDLKTGGILAMVSRPNFNPEFFSGVLDREEWQSLVNDPDRPLHNKFLQGIYSPGSTFKIVVALAGLQEEIIDPSVISYCSGAVRVYDRVFHCWKGGGHGSVGIENAIKGSCNVFFYRLGKKLDIDIIAKYATMLGLGELTGIDLPNENGGLVPTKEWKQRTLKQKWFPGETISVAIGGGMLNITPIQALQMISTVALRGRKPKLHLLKSIKENGETVMEFRPQSETVPIDKENFELVIEGLYRVVNHEGGTARSARLPNLEICGKTGTQQVISKENPNYKTLVKQDRFKPHAWFVSFAPRTNPEIALVVFVENGGDAGAIAAPLAGKIYKHLF